MTGRLLVVGGGIAGFGLARALSLRGVSCTLVERLSAPSVPGLGLNLPGNAVRALAALGLADEVVDRGMRIRRREYRNQAGRLLFAVDEEAFWGTVGASVCLRRGDLLDVLRASTAEVTPRWDTPIAGAELMDEGVRVRLESGAMETYDFVAAADGVHSSLRAAVIPEDSLRRSLMTETSWRFTAPNPGVDCWTVWSGARGTSLLIPVDEEHVYGYASSTRGGGAGDDPRWLDTIFAGFPEPVSTTVAAVLDDRAQLYYSPVEEVRCQRWSRGRLVLIGDAAHATGPVWAQGAALALEDALVLADLLAARSDWSRVGAEFERLRRPRVTHVQAATDKMSRIAALPARLRDLVAPVLGCPGAARAPPPAGPPAPGRRPAPDCGVAVGRAWPAAPPGSAGPGVPDRAWDRAQPQPRQPRLRPPRQLGRAGRPPAHAPPRTGLGDGREQGARQHHRRPASPRRRRRAGPARLHPPAPPDRPTGGRTDRGRLRPSPAQSPAEQQQPHARPSPPRGRGHEQAASPTEQFLANLTRLPTPLTGPRGDAIPDAPRPRAAGT